MNLLVVVTLFCALSFLIYGLSCLRNPKMIAEFDRYHLAEYRELTGWLQLLGATGLLVGFSVPWLGGLAAGGLSLQMACGLGVRVRLRDSWLQCAPSAIYMLLCGWVATQLL